MVFKEERKIELDTVLRTLYPGYQRLRRAESGTRRYLSNICIFFDWRLNNYGFHVIIYFHRLLYVPNCLNRCLSTHLFAHKLWFTIIIIIVGNESDENEDPDLFQCGKCRTMFTNLQKYLKHKSSRECRQKNNSTPSTVTSPGFSEPGVSSL